VSGDLRLSGHTLAAVQIRKHGKDRYPSPGYQSRKVIEEAIELLCAIREHGRFHDILCPSLAQCPNIRREYADTGLALFELGNKLGLDLIECMTELVNADERTF
jgi:hypothetical protein